MALELITTPYGPAASEALERLVDRAKTTDPLAPVTVIVPTNYSGVSLRRLLARRPQGVANVTFLTLYRLAELLGASVLATSGRRPVTRPVLAGAVRAAVRAQPGMFAEVAHHPATEAALLAAYREAAHLSAGPWTRLSARSERAAEVLRLVSDTRRRLEGEWYDEDDLVEAAIGSLAQGGPMASGLGQVVVFLPQRLGRVQCQLVRAVGDHTSVCIAAGTTGARDADSTVVTTLARLGVGIDLPEASPSVGHPPPSLPTAQRIITTSDPDDEVRAAVRIVLEAAGRGTPLERIALLHPTPQPYARLLGEHLEAAGVAFSGEAVRPLTERVTARTLLGLLDLPERGFSRPAVMAVLASAPVVDRAGRPLPVSAWERLAREAGVVGGAAHWDTRLSLLAADRRARAVAAHGPDAPERAARRAELDANRADWLRDLVGHLATQLTTAVPTTWAGFSAWARWLLGILGKDDDRAGWPPEEVDGANRVEAALERLASLDPIDPHPDLPRFRRTLEAELEADLGRVGSLGRGVLVGGLATALGVDLDLVVVCGCSEGLLPSRVREDSLFPDSERVVTDGELTERGEHVGDQHRSLLAALAAAPESVLLHPRGDLRAARARVASRWALDTARALSGGALSVHDLAELNESWLEHVPSYASGVLHCTVPATEAEHNLRSLAVSIDAGRSLDDHPLAGLDGFRHAIEMIHARRSGGFTRFDGNLSALDLPVPGTAKRFLSPTALEAWVSHPLGYLVERVLGVQMVVEPEDSLTISPLDLGTIVHEALDRFLTEAAASRPGGPLPTEAWDEHQRRRLLEIADLLHDELGQRGLSGRPVFQRRDRARLHRDLDEWIERDSEHRATLGARVVATELCFGVSGAPPVELKLDDGTVVRLRGAADRVDRLADGTLLVIDYKTGSRRGYTGLSADDPHLGGQRLQLPVYGLAAAAAHGADVTDVEARYWFISRKGDFAWEGYRLTNDVLDRFRSVVSLIVSSIGGGLFPDRITDPNRDFFWRPSVADPDGLGAGERFRAWEQARRHPLLEDYVQLLEGPLPAGGSAGEAS